MRLTEPALIVSKFRGSILGALVGDCCGGPFEGQSLLQGGERTLLRKNLDRLEGPFFDAPEKAHSDDSIMSRSVARTLIDHGAINQTEMSKHFVREYLRDPYRGYGEAVVTVFRKMRQNRFRDVLTPAREQFAGTGSFGNGGAMRVAPVALFCHRRSLDELIAMAVAATEPTHTHAQGVHGGVLQALAVSAALACDPTQPLDGAVFVRALAHQMERVERRDDEGLGLEPTKPFTDQLRKVEQLLDKEPSESEIVNVLGTQVSALYSVPTAIHCFLRANGQIPGICSDNPFRRALEYAISLGGDTDTIASMTGAITGAFYGEAIIPANLLRHCESNAEFRELADALYAASCGDGPESAATTAAAALEKRSAAEQPKL